jgi:hypothetical protein
LRGTGDYEVSPTFPSSFVTPRLNIQGYVMVVRGIRRKSFSSTGVCMYDIA